MLRNALMTIVMTVISVVGIAQNTTIKGTVTDKDDKKPVTGATVSLLLQKDSSTVKTVVSDNVGRFQFSNLESEAYIIKINTINFQSYSYNIPVGNDAIDLGNIGLEKQGKDLVGVTVVSQAPPVIQKGDTSQFSASQYKVNPDATTEDLIKKMPGITVARDGTVTAQGEQVKKVTIDGKDFFGDDASAALKNLPSTVVDKIQVFDRLSDQAQLTGVDDGNSVKAINIVTKSGIKNGQFGRIYAGYGTDDRYQAGGNASFFKGDRRLSIVGNFNNINQQNFGSQDLLGVTSTGGGGGGNRGGGGGFGGGNNNFLVGQSNGISSTNAIGINYSNQYGPKLSLTASYFYNQSTNNNQSVVNTETATPGSYSVFTEQTGTTKTTNNNHRFNMRLEYKIDSNNSLFIIPSINYQKNNSSNLSFADSYYGTTNDSLSRSFLKSPADRNGYDIRNNIMFRHSFAKKGRSLSLGLNTIFSRNSSDVITDAFYRFYDNGLFNDSIQNQYADNLTNGQKYTFTISYTEPIGKKGQLQIEYNPSIQKNNTDQLTYLYDGQKYNEFDSTLSNSFDNTITTNTGGLTYRYIKNKDEMFSVGVNLQNAELESQRTFPSIGSLKQSFFDVLPNAMWRKKFNARSNIRIFYRSSVNFPTISQLQDVLNLSNPLRVTTGNPLLEQSNTQFIAGRYSYTNSKTSKSFFANIFMQAASNYISNAIYIPTKDSLIQNGVLLQKGSQLSKPVNLDGYKSIRSFFTYSMPIKAIKTTMNFNAGFSYSDLPGMVNDVATTTDNYITNAGVVFASNISEYIDFTLSYTASFNQAINAFNPSLSNRYINQSTGITVNLLNKKGWFIQNDVNNQTNSGLSEGFNQNYWLWNAAIGKRFGKNKTSELKLSVFDLLKQNQSITRTVTGYDIQDSKNEVLQQYFMLTYTYSIKNFGTAKPTNKSSEDGPGGYRRPGGPGF